MYYVAHNFQDLLCIPLEAGLATGYFLAASVTRTVTTVWLYTELCFELWHHDTGTDEYRLLLVYNAMYY